MVTFAYADSIFINQNRPVDTETTIQVRSFEIIDHSYTPIPANVTVEVNNQIYSGETNSYGFIAFPIKLTDTIFEDRVYNVTVSINDKTFERVLKVLQY